MIVASSTVQNQLCSFLANYLNTAPSAWICLYTNDLPLNPDIESASSYVEASYPGYARFGTVGLWSVAMRDNPGIYHTESGPFTFALNAGAAAISAYGWFLLRAGLVAAAERFLGAPYVINAGRPGPTIKPRLVQGAQAVVCPAK